MGEATIPVSVVIPVRNEERNLPECLARLDGFAEVLVVDSGSTDDTRNIAARHGARLVDFHWDGKFPKKRNWCLRNLTFRAEWVLFLDADERVDETFKRELRETLSHTVCNGFVVYYENWFMGRRLRHGDRMRKFPLLRLGKGEYEQIEEDHWSDLDMEVHEHPVIEGAVGALHASIEHCDFRGMDAYRRRHEAYAAWEAQRFLALRRSPGVALTRRQRVKYLLLDTWLAGPLYFLAAYVVKGGFLDGSAGFRLAACKWEYLWGIKRRIDALRRG